MQEFINNTKNERENSTSKDNCLTSRGKTHKIFTKLKLITKGQHKRRYATERQVQLEITVAMHT